MERIQSMSLLMGNSNVDPVVIGQILFRQEFPEHQVGFLEGDLESINVVEVEAKLFVEFQQLNHRNRSCLVKRQGGPHVDEYTAGRRFEAAAHVLEIVHQVIEFHEHLAKAFFHYSVGVAELVGPHGWEDGFDVTTRCCVGQKGVFFFRLVHVLVLVLVCDRAATFEKDSGEAVRVDFDGVANVVVCVDRLAVFRINRHDGRHQVRNGLKVLDCPGVFFQILVVGLHVLCEILGKGHVDVLPFFGISNDSVDKTLHLPVFDSRWIEIIEKEWIKLAPKCLSIFVKAEFVGVVHNELFATGRRVSEDVAVAVAVVIRC
mmetsp:Transcript_14291/g.30294  ORF Transcript_14291/g.30294 Transcript_14291/m.30294 type:complete len:317 (+) Transcript_14291:768-1718(+)